MQLTKELKKITTKQKRPLTKFRMFGIAMSYLLFQQFCMWFSNLCLDNYGKVITVHRLTVSKFSCSFTVLLPGGGTPENFG